MRLHEHTSRAFFWLGLRIDTHPKAALLASLATSLLCMLGLVWLDVVTEYEDLWVPRTVQSWHDKAVYEDNFGKPDKQLRILITAADGSSNMLTLPRLQAALAVHQRCSACCRNGPRHLARGRCRMGSACT